VYSAAAAAACEEQKAALDAAVHEFHAQAERDWGCARMPPPPPARATASWEGASPSVMLPRYLPAPPQPHMLRHVFVLAWGDVPSTTSSALHTVSRSMRAPTLGGEAGGRGSITELWRSRVVQCFVYHDLVAVQH